MQILLIKRYVIWTKFPQMKSLYFKRFYHLRKKKTIRIHLKKSRKGWGRGKQNSEGKNDEDKTRNK